MDCKICDRCKELITGKKYLILNCASFGLPVKNYDLCPNCFDVFLNSFMAFIPQSECELFQYSSIGSEGIEHCHGWCEKCRSIVNCGGLKKHCKVGESNDEQQTKN